MTSYPKSDFAPSRIIDDNNCMLFGKHKGKSIKELTEHDYKYLYWLRTQPWARTNEEFMKQIEHLPRVDLTWGKHKNKTLDWVYVNDPKYIDFLRECSFLKNNPAHAHLLEKLKLMH